MKLSEEKRLEEAERARREAEPPKIERNWRVAGAGIAATGLEGSAVFNLHVGAERAVLTLAAFEAFAMSVRAAFAERSPGAIASAFGAEGRCRRCGESDPKRKQGRCQNVSGSEHDWEETP